MWNESQRLLHNYNVTLPLRLAQKDICSCRPLVAWGDLGDFREL